MKILAVYKDKSLGDFSNAITALEAVVAQVPSIQLHLKCDQKYKSLLKNAWFLKDVLAPDADESGYDAVCELRTDINACYKSEMAYRKGQKEKVDAYIKMYTAKTGTPTHEVPKPPDYSILSSTDPLWDRMMSYLLNFRLDAGLERDVQLVGIARPYLPTPKGAKDIANKYLHTNRASIKPGVPYVIVSDVHMFKQFGLDEVPLPSGWALIEVSESEMDPAVIAALVANPRCKAVLSAVGGLSHVAWAADKDAILEVTDEPGTAYFEATRADNGISVDLTSEQTTPESLAVTIGELYNNRNKE